MLTTPQAHADPAVLQPAAMPGRACRNRGFTLIELLVVILIIGIVLTFVSLAIDVNGKAERLDRSAHRLLALTRTAATDAVLYGVELGLEITPAGYRFVRLGNDGWEAVTDETALRPRTLDPDLQLLRIALENDKRTALLPAAQAGHADNADDDVTHGAANDAPSNEDDKDGARHRPVAIFLSSGELLPFVLELSTQGLEHRYQLRGLANGRIELSKIGAAP